MSDPHGYGARMNSSCRHSTLAVLTAEIDNSPIDDLPLYAPTAELWHAAGVFVTDDALALTESEAAASGHLGILTRHARPLSWLLFELRNDSRLTGGTALEPEFFGRLADAANGFLAAHQPEEQDWRPLLVAVLHEVGAILRDRNAAFIRDQKARPRVVRRRRTHRLGIGMLLAA